MLSRHVRWCERTGTAKPLLLDSDLHCARFDAHFLYGVFYVCSSPTNTVNFTVLVFL